MLLYKYRGLDNLWQVLDILLSRRLYCAHWSQLNDPLEGRFQVYFPIGNVDAMATAPQRCLRGTDTSLRIASLSADPSNYLLWSHYADAQKGVAVELDIPSNHTDLFRVQYKDVPSSEFMWHCLTDAPFSPEQELDEAKWLFTVKNTAWAYEAEYRVITQDSFWPLPAPVKRILCGPSMPPDRRSMLEAILPDGVALLSMELDPTTGRLEPREA